MFIWLIGPGESRKGSAFLLPPFSWDKVPVYMHSGDSEGLTEEEVEHVANHCDFCCFEKTLEWYVELHELNRVQS